MEQYNELVPVKMDQVIIDGHKWSRITKEEDCLQVSYSSQIKKILIL